MKTVKLLLTENVDNLGIVGDVVEVKPGYARNYLVPFGLATEPTQGNIDRLAERRRQVEEEMKRRRAQLEKMIETLEGYEITLERSANDQGVLYGGVTQHDIAESLREQGFDIEDRMVRIGEQVKRLDSYMIPVQLDQDLKCEVKLWVVSDRPLETDEEEEEEGEEGESIREEAEELGETAPVPETESDSTPTS